jgi:hypothetical protein
VYSPPRWLRTASTSPTAPPERVGAVDLDGDVTSQVGQSPELRLRRRGADRRGSQDVEQLDAGDSDASGRAEHERPVAGGHVRPAEHVPGGHICGRERRGRRRLHLVGEDHEAVGVDQRPLGESAVVQREVLTEVLRALAAELAGATRLVRTEDHPIAGGDGGHAVADLRDGPGEVEPRDERQVVAVDHRRVPLEDPEVVAVDRARPDVDDGLPAVGDRRGPLPDLDARRSDQLRERGFAHVRSRRPAGA